MLRILTSALVGTTPMERRLTLDKIELAANNARIAIYVLPGALVAMAAVSLQWAQPVTAALWLGAGLLATALVSWSYRFIDRVRDDLGRVEQAGGALMLGNGLLQALLISGAILFWDPATPESHLFWLLVLAVCQATAAAVLAPWLAAGLSTGVLGAAASGLAFWQGGFTYMLVGSMGLMLMVALGGVAFSLNKTAAAMLRLRREQAKLIEDLTGANKAKTDFLANMSHELRTPLNAIIGFSEVMKDEMMGPLGAKAYKGYTNDIHASGTLLLSLINDILDMAKIDAGKFELHEEEVDLGALVDEARRMLQLKADKAGVSLVNDVPPGIKLWADRRAIRQVALNLATNAVKFTPAGGFVRASVKLGPKGELGLQVRDTGRGIQAEDLEKVFENFGQSRHDIAAAKDRGTGLGLPIVRGLMRAHGGDVTITSELGKGTRVFVSLPAHRIMSFGQAKAA